ncbi:E3 ubiquitin-protein ligase COP1-like [Temnothorax curvispinosus]|uniref:E3 ubiquitin-protein ligase COP1-like n=1 Tax=Temnothorax curvispinosus TaxID=300111 RepID=A0A6J1RBK2_9HYME|nr:E3 ubiquitin-protein ligase COP1-like [Temnothorax curvispinosus]
MYILCSLFILARIEGHQIKEEAVNNKQLICIAKYHGSFVVKSATIIYEKPIVTRNQADYCRFSISGVDKMNIVCVICSDLLAPSDDVFHTPCGHIFHFACLIQWLKRSKTCPQCRDRTTEQTIRRIYFNFSNSDSIAEDAASLQNRIDTLILILKLKDEIRKLTEENGKLETQYYRKENEHLKKNIQHLEKELEHMSNKSREVREKYEKLQQEYTRVSTENKVINPDSTENTPQSIKSQGFFSMRDNDIKRQKSNNSLKETSILAKKSKFYQPDQKTASGSGMSFDGFRGHARYDKFPNPIPSSHVKKTRKDLRMKKPKLDTGESETQ